MLVGDYNTGTENESAYDDSEDDLPSSISSLIPTPSMPIQIELASQPNNFDLFLNHSLA